MVEDLPTKPKVAAKRPKKKPKTKKNTKPKPKSKRPAAQWTPDPLFDDGMYHPGRKCRTCKPHASFEDGLYHPGVTGEAASKGYNLPMTPEEAEVEAAATVTKPSKPGAEAKKTKTKSGKVKRSPESDPKKLGEADHLDPLGHFYGGGSSGQQ
ncbi:hypothetical protein IE53DRAFT_385649 [Violaceomyces palustris]|uniref:Uncharacterized protein n=1 Tax=Violaceomyces palustris TaxID=1673888 RepID=A0ACD0P1D9_9BASI|nr:hypothetical protein IE53DRAFT_385649 [Violaceomyces palustris]